MHYALTVPMIMPFKFLKYFSYGKISFCLLAWGRKRVAIPRKMVVYGQDLPAWKLEE